MKRILDTQRTFLREMEEGDATSLMAIIHAPDGGQATLDYALAWIAWCRKSYADYGFGHYAVVDRETEKLIGSVGISRQWIDDDWKMEIGYHIHPSYHGKGIGKETSSACIDYFFTHSKDEDIYCYMNRDNVASFSLAESNGMRYLHLYTTKRGEVCRVYRLLRKEWKERPKKRVKWVNGAPYEILSLLGKGKGGYSYLARKGDEKFVVKQIHHEPCAYYSFGDKIEAERNDYARLLSAGIPMPLLYDIDFETEVVVKEFIEGDVVSELLRAGEDVSDLFPQLIEMAEKARKAGLNIDYYPTNFVRRGETLYYVDYECNEYMDEWSLERWGMAFWKGETPLK